MLPAFAKSANLSVSLVFAPTLRAGWFSGFMVASTDADRRVGLVKNIGVTRDSLVVSAQLLRLFGAALLESWKIVDGVNFKVIRQLLLWFFTEYFLEAKMKKLSSLTLALLLGITGVVFAAGAGEVLKETKELVTVDGTRFEAGTRGTEIKEYAYDHAVNVNGTTYPAGTKFTVLKTSAGQFVPVATSQAVAAATATATATAATAAGAGAVAGGTVAAGVVAFTAVVVVATNNNNTAATATATQ
ncbi:MAG: hypothetical protein HY849_07465 [Nitrosomonadales bacterium]|nr:hypothetical protein [Nitrosomonadales bacterium]